MDDKVKEYNSWAISWLDGFSTGMEKAVDGKLYIEQQKVIFTNEAGSITVNGKGSKYTASEQFKKQYHLYLDSYLARDIFECVSKNETYITQNAVVQLMRGTKVTLNANVLESRGHGFYSLYSADEVQTW